MASCSNKKQLSLDVYHLVAYVFTLSGLPVRFEGAVTRNYLNGCGCGLGPLSTTTTVFFIYMQLQEWLKSGVDLNDCPY